METVMEIYMCDRQKKYHLFSISFGCFNVFRCYFIERKTEICLTSQHCRFIAEFPQKSQPSLLTVLFLMLCIVLLNLPTA